MKSALLCLREVKSSLTNTEKTIADYILSNPEDILTMSIQDLAKETYTSPSSIIRVCHSVGFKGYKDLHKALAYDLASLNSSTGNITEVSKDDSTLDIIRKITSLNIQSLEETQKLISDETVLECAKLISKCNTIYLFGIGSSLCVAKDAYLKFFRLNKTCIVNDDWHSQLLQARNATSKDLGIIFSYSGQTVEMIECMKNLKTNRTPTIAITRYSPSPIAELATYKLYTSAKESLFRNGAMTSRISQLNIIDILYTAYTSLEYDYCKKQLLRTHILKPNGSNDK